MRLNIENFDNIQHQMKYSTILLGDDEISLDKDTEAPLDRISAIRKLLLFDARLSSTPLDWNSKR